MNQMPITINSSFGEIKFPDSAVQMYGCPDGDPSNLVQHVEMVRECYDSLSEVVQTFKPKASLDIGSGLAVIDILLARSGVTSIHLMDGDGTEKKVNGFHEATPPWYSVNLGFEIVQQNVPEDVLVYRHLAAPSVRVAVDLIISTRAWGHHFPIKTYLDLAKRSLNDGGCIIVDIRKNTTGYNDMLEAGFKEYRELPSFSQKCSRFVFVRK